jgi:hypothetical protein
MGESIGGKIMSMNLIQSKYVLYVGLAYLTGILSVSGICSMVYFKRRQVLKLLKHRVNTL